MRRFVSAQTCWSILTSPANWDLEADADASRDSVLLGTFRTDVSFGKIIVVALPQVPGEPGAD
jgi:hypothetical protein